MSTSLSLLKTKIRNKLRANYKDTSALASAISSTATSALVTIGTGDRISGGDLLEIGTEVVRVDDNPMPTTFLGSALNNSDTYMRVDSVADLSAGYLIKIQEETLLVTATSASVYLSATRAVRGTSASSYGYNAAVYNPDALRITRGFQGSTAASAASGTTVNVCDVWTAVDLEQAINDAIRYMRPILYKDYRTDVKEWGSTTSQSSLGSDTTADQVSEWSSSNDATTPALNTTGQFFGAGCINLGITTATSAATQATYEATFSNAVDGTSAEFANFAFYVADINDTNDEPIYARNLLRVRVGSNSANYYEQYFTRDELHEEWNALTWPFKQSTQSGTVVNSALQYARVDIFENTYNPANVTAGDLRMEPIRLANFPIMNSKHSIELPFDVSYIGQVRAYTNEAATNFQQLLDFELRESGSTSTNRKYELRFRNEHTEGTPLELIGARYFELDSASNLDIPPEYEEFLIIYATMHLMEDRMPERIRFDKYSARTNTENSQLLDYIRTINSYKDRITDFINHNAKSMDAQFMDFGQDGQ